MRVNCKILFSTVSVLSLTLSSLSSPVLGMSDDEDSPPSISRGKTPKKQTNVDNAISISDGESSEDEQPRQKNNGKGKIIEIFQSPLEEAITKIKVMRGRLDQLSKENPEFVRLKNKIQKQQKYIFELQQKSVVVSDDESGSSEEVNSKNENLNSHHKEKSKARASSSSGATDSAADFEKTFSKVLKSDHFLNLVAKQSMQLHKNGAMDTEKNIKLTQQRLRDMSLQEGREFEEFLVKEGLTATQKKDLKNSPAFDLRIRTLIMNQFVD